ERVPGGLVAAAERLAAEHLDEPGDGGDDGADLDHEHHRVADLDPWIAPDDVRPEQRDRSALGAGAAGGAVDRSIHRHQWPPVIRSRARLSCSTFTPGSPENPSPRPCVYRATSDITRASGSLRTAAMRWAWMSALAGEMSGSIPDADVLTASTGIFAVVRPGS